MDGSAGMREYFSGWVHTGTAAGKRTRTTQESRSGPLGLTLAEQGNCARRMIMTRGDLRVIHGRCRFVTLPFFDPIVVGAKLAHVNEGQQLL